MSPREKMRTVYSNCRAYADKFHENSPSLFFIGKTGLGKTFLSACIANELIQKGYSVIFASLLKLLRQIEDEHFGRATGQTLDIIENADLVILDDLGSEFQTSFTDSVIYEIINERINLGRPTIISTNLTKSMMISVLSREFMLISFHSAGAFASRSTGIERKVPLIFFIFYPLKIIFQLYVSNIVSYTTA